jgi:hypothetical protein
MDPQASQKRTWDFNDELDAASTTSSPQPRDPRRDKRARLSANSPIAQYVLVHRVLCSRSERYHERHQSSADYFDVPRLLAGANRTTALQGQQALVDVEGFLEDRGGFSFVVYISYRCETYHNTFRRDFTRVQMPRMDHDIETTVKPYFQIFQQDGSFATSTSEVMVLSADLEEVLRKLHELYPDSLREWQETEKLLHPYPQLYQCKEFFVGDSIKALDQSHQVHLGALCGYLDERVKENYDEAAALFKVGLVSQKHWTKLFCAGEIVVTIRDGQPSAFTMASSPLHHGDALALRCWSWDFNGSFSRRESTLQNEWPSNSTRIAITDLPVYPLRYAEDGLEKRLRSRGQTFWACRKQKYISYDVPLQGLSVQIVSGMPHI